MSMRGMPMMLTWLDLDEDKALSIFSIVSHIDNHQHHVAHVNNQCVYQIGDEDTQHKPISIFSTVSHTHLHLVAQINNQCRQSYPPVSIVSAANHTHLLPVLHFYAVNHTHLHPAARP